MNCNEVICATFVMEKCFKNQIRLLLSVSLVTPREQGREAAEIWWCGHEALNLQQYKLHLRVRRCANSRLYVRQASLRESGTVTM